jgi:hypothetical protein
MRGDNFASTAAQVADCVTKEQAEVQASGSMKTCWRLRDGGRSG